MSNWAYVALAFGVAWSALIFYALLLARRLSQAEHTARAMRAAQSKLPESSLPRTEEAGDSPLCDAPPAP